MDNSKLIQIFELRLFCDLRHLKVSKTIYYGTETRKNFNIKYVSYLHKINKEEVGAIKKENFDSEYFCLFVYYLDPGEEAHFKAALLQAAEAIVLERIAAANRMKASLDAYNISSRAVSVRDYRKFDL